MILCLQSRPILSSTPQAGLQAGAQVHRNDNFPDSSDNEDTDDIPDGACGGLPPDDSDFHSVHSRSSLETTLMDGQGEGGVVADLRQGMDQLNLASQGIQHATGARPRTRPQDHTYHTADDPPYRNTTQAEGPPPIPARRQLPGVQTYHLPGDPRTTVVVNIHQQQPPPPPLPAARRPMPGAEDEDANADPLNQTLSHGQVLRINARRIRRDAIDLAHRAADFFLFSRRPH